jgi:hypothetical protein
MLSTENIGLKKPGYNDEADIAVINENSDIIDREFGNRYLKSETYSVEQANNAIAQAIEALPNGLVYRGAVNYYKDLPTTNNELGDTYSVKYQGETGTTADGNEYAWGEYDGTLQWIKLGVNAYTKDEIDAQREAIESDISNAEKEIARVETSLQNQIDGIVLGASESGDVTSEVVQARTNTDGTTYPTLKTRLDAEQKVFKSAINDVNREVTEVNTNGCIPVSFTTEQGGVNASGEEYVNDNPQYRRTSYIETAKCESIKVCRAGTGVNMWYVTFDTNKNVVEKVSIAEAGDFYIPLTTPYIRIMGYKGSHLTEAEFFNIVTIVTKRHLALLSDFMPIEEQISDIKTNTLETTYSNNRFNRETLTTNKFINKSGTMGSDEQYSVTDFIEVKEGEVLNCGFGFYALRPFRFVTAYDVNKNVVADAGVEVKGKYTVPNGIRYVRVTVNNEHCVNEDFRISTGNYLLRYEEYSQSKMPIGTAKTNKEMYDIKNAPITTLGLTNALMYKPLGNMTKPYYCLITDDGYEGVATYSIPTLVKGKGVPMTFGIAKTSPVLEEQYLPTLKDAIENDGCTVAQHGFTRFTEFNEDQLNAFFDAEKEYFDSIGLEMKGAICPGHNINAMVSAVCGNRFKCLRTGYLTQDKELGTVYPFQVNGSKSNVYALDCINISTETLQAHKNRIDYAVENNCVVIGFFHEWEIEDEQKAQIEAIVDYAIEKGMEFVTLDQIPYLI